MVAQNDPLSTAALVGFIAVLLGIIYRELRGQITDRDKRIERLEASVAGMADRSTSLAASAERMLQYFLDREQKQPPPASPTERSAPP